jgi:hypothetical protein
VTCLLSRRDKVEAVSMGFYDELVGDQDQAMKPFCYSALAELKMTFLCQGCIWTNSSNQVGECAHVNSVFKCAAVLVAEM